MVIIDEKGIIKLMIELLIRIMADGLVVAVVLIAVFALLFRLRHDDKRIETYARIVIAGLTSYLFAKLIGSVFQPELERPFQQLGETAGALYLDNPGFPSDHVLFCIAIFWGVWFESRTRWIAYTILSLTLLIALGRVLALVHTPLDVIGGLVIGSIGALWYLQVPRSAHAMTASRKKRKKQVQ